MLADAVRDLVEKIPALDVPFPNAWRYAFIVLGLFVVGFEFAIARYVYVVPDRVHRIGLRLSAAGTGTIVFLLVVSLYLRLGAGPISPLIYPGLAGELALAIGLGLRIRRYREQFRGAPAERRFG